MEAVQGKRLIYMYRLLSEQATTDGTRLAFVEEDELSYSKDADSTETKDGIIRTPGSAEIEKTMTSILAKGDTMIKRLRNAMLNDELVEIWEANLDELIEEMYAKTSDTDIVPGKNYYTLSGSTYTKVESPTKANLNSYYEVTAGKFEGTYFQGYITELTKSSPSDGAVAINFTIGVNGNGVDGYVTVPIAQQEDASYVFVDTPATGE